MKKYSLSQCAEKIGVSRKTVWRLVQDGLLKAHQPKGMRKYLVEDYHLREYQNAR